MNAAPATPDAHSSVPVWLLDVDGVLNALSRPGWHAPPARRYAHVDGLEFKLRWAPSLIDAIVDLHRSKTVEIRWATSWVNHTDQLCRLMGLPRFPLAFTLPVTLKAATDELHAATEAAKRVAALATITPGRRLLWTDDDAIFLVGTPERDALEAAGSLLIAPDDRRGLQPEDIDKIRAWLSHGAAAQVAP